MRKQLPHSHTCFVCGESNPIGLNARFIDDGESVFTEYTFHPDQAGYRATTHGGILMALLDETLGWAACVKQGQFCYLAELKTRFLLPVPVGRPMIVRGIFKGERLGFWFSEGEVTDAEGAAYVKAEGRYSPFTSEQTDEVMQMLIGDDGPVSRESVFS